MRKLTAICGLLFCAAVMTTAVKAETVTTSMNFRSEPSVTGGLIGGVPQGATVTVLSSQNGWDYVSYNGVNGWIHGGNITTQAVQVPQTAPAAAASTNTSTGTAASSGASTQTVKVLYGMNFRATPGMDGRIMTGIPAGTTVQYLGSSNGWDKVVFNGMTGWIAAGRITTVGMTNLVTNSSSVAAQTSAAVSGSSKTVTTTMNFRATGALAGSLIGLVPVGSKVTYVTSANGWDQIIYNGKSGWIKGGNMN